MLRIFWHKINVSIVRCVETTPSIPSMQNQTVEVQFWAGNPRNNLMVNAYEFICHTLILAADSIPKYLLFNLLFYSLTVPFCILRLKGHSWQLRWRQTLASGRCCLMMPLGRPGIDVVNAKCLWSTVSLLFGGVRWMSSTPLSHFFKVKQQTPCT